MIESKPEGKANTGSNISVLDELQGRLYHDYSGSLFYSEYKPLIDQLYYLVGTEQN